VGILYYRLTTGRRLRDFVPDLGYRFRGCPDTHTQMIVSNTNLEEVGLQESLPEELLVALDRDGLDSSEIREAARADLLPDGRFGDEYLLLLNRLILVYRLLEDGWFMREALPLSCASEAAVQTMTCGGELTVSSAGMPRRLVAFSAARIREFVALAPRLSAIARGQDHQLEDDVQARLGSKCSSCGRAFEPGSQSCPHCTGKGKLLWRLVDQARPYKGYVIAILALLLVGVVIGLVPPYIVRVMVDNVLTAGEHPEWLLPLVVTIFVLHAVRAVINVLHGQLAVKVGSQMTTDLRKRLFAHLTRLSVSFYDRFAVGRLMTRVAQDTEELHVFIAQSLRGFLVPCVMAAGITVMLFWLHPVLAIYTMAPLPLVALAMYFFFKQVTPRHERYWKSRSRMNSLLNTVFSGIRVVKAFGQEQREQERFEDANVGLRDARRASDMIWAAFHPLVLLAFQSSGMMVWYFGGNRVIGQDITLGTLLAFLGYLAMLHAPLQVLSQVGQWLTRSLTSAQRVFEMLDRQPEISEPLQPETMGRLCGEVEFQNVTFGYVPNQPVIKNLSFKIRPGEVVGVVGRSGAGKTTLGGLIARFYDSQSGKVMLDGRDVTEIGNSELRSNVGLVLQEPFIFRGSISENIGYGKPFAGRDELLKAAVAADCHEFVSAMPLGYDSEVGERGAGLSGGEKQRVSIARALLHDPRVLILDEATSSLDTEAERVIHEALDKLVEGRTVIIIAHRLVTLRGCDRILVMDRGQLVEQGSHQELMARPGGVYRRLVESQERPRRVTSNSKNRGQMAAGVA
jgi:ATP-binding cassette, subfamily B, bacterial